MGGQAVYDFRDQRDRRDYAMPEAEQELRQRPARGGMLGLLGPSDASGQSEDGDQPDSDANGSFHAFFLAETGWRPSFRIAKITFNRIQRRGA